MAEVLFFLAAIGALAGALGTVSLHNPFYSVLALVCHLLALAALFLLLRAEFVAAYIGGFEEPLWDAIPGQRILAPLLGLALFVELSIAVLGTGLSALGEEGAGFFEGFGTPAEIGRLLLTDFLLAFEVASMLLLVAAVGAVVLARRRTGLEDPREISVGDLMRTGSRDMVSGGEAGTMIEVEGPRGR